MRIAFCTPVTPARVSPSSISGAEACRSTVGVFGAFAIRYNLAPPMSESRFPRVVSLACHDLRTPLATVYGFARTLTRADELDDRSLRFLGMIEEASEQMTGLLDELGTAARIQAGRWEPGVREVSTLGLASSDDERIDAVGDGVEIETEVDIVARSLQALAIAAIRHGPVEQVTW